MIGSDIAPRDTVLTWDLELWGPDDLKIQREEIPKESVAILGHRMDRHVFNVYKMFMQQYMEGKITYTALPGLPPFTTNPCIWRGLQSLLWSTKREDLVFYDCIDDRDRNMPFLIVWVAFRARRRGCR